MARLLETQGRQNVINGLNPILTRIVQYIYVTNNKGESEFTDLATTYVECHAVHHIPVSAPLGIIVAVYYTRN